MLARLWFGKSLGEEVRRGQEEEREGRQGAEKADERSHIFCFPKESRFCNVVFGIKNDAL